MSHPRHGRVTSGPDSVIPLTIPREPETAEKQKPTNLGEMAAGDLRFGFELGHK